jgi:hypothetical protein
MKAALSCVPQAQHHLSQSIALPGKEMGGRRPMGKMRGKCFYFPFVVQGWALVI